MAAEKQVERDGNEPTRDDVGAKPRELGHDENSRGDLDHPGQMHERATRNRDHPLDEWIQVLGPVREQIRELVEARDDRHDAVTQT
ncbi:hypothetical protein D3C83_50190 [compost metagenome]